MHFALSAADFNTLKMIVKLMGLGDLFSAVITMLAAAHPLTMPANILSYAAGYLILKGGLFSLTGNAVSYLDVLCGINIILLGYGISLPLLTLFSVIFLTQKTAFAFFAG